MILLILKEEAKLEILKEKSALHYHETIGIDIHCEPREKQTIGVMDIQGEEIIQTGDSKKLDGSFVATVINDTWRKLSMGDVGIHKGKEKGGEYSNESDPTLKWMNLRMARCVTFLIFFFIFPRRIDRA